jgi:hypothetical protein
MNILKSYVSDWLSQHDPRIEDERFQLLENAIENITDLVCNGVDGCVLRFKLEDAYTTRNAEIREVYFQRGMTFAYIIFNHMKPSLIQLLAELSEPQQFLTTNRHTGLFKYDRRPVDDEFILQTQQIIEGYLHTIRSMAKEEHATFFSSFMNEMVRLNGVLEDEIKEVYFLRGMVHGHGLFSSLVADANEFISA